PVTDTGVAIARKAPHPHAAMLLMDFLMSKEGQTRYLDLGYDSARRDVAGPGAQVQKLYLTNRPNFIREYEDWARLYQDTFVRRRLGEASADQVTACERSRPRNPGAAYRRRGLA